jgi:hypothetical protein
MGAFSKTPMLVNPKNTALNAQSEMKCTKVLAYGLVLYHFISDLKMREIMITLLVGNEEPAHRRHRSMRSYHTVWCARRFMCFLKVCGGCVV